MKKIFIMAALLLAVNVSAQNIELPEPVKTGGMPLMEALSKRASYRNFSQEPLSNQTISNLLWAAWGYNRKDKRTAPSANNKQEITLYVVLPTGAYEYNALENKLIEVVKGDVRKSMGKQEFVATAPLNIIFVAHKDFKGIPETNCGFISQNIYLFCASENLGTVARGWFEEDKVREALKLDDKEQVVLTQSVGKKK